MKLQLSKRWFLSALSVLITTAAFAYINPVKSPKPAVNQDASVSFREDCTTSTAQTDQGLNRLTGLAVNNVRARLLTGGDVWWNRADNNAAKYIVPYVAPGEAEVSSIFAGAIWIGGFDPAGTLKLAGQTYGNASGESEYWSGPLDDNTGKTEDQVCRDWDRFFEVYDTEIDDHREKFALAQANGEVYDPADIPAGVKGWPGKNNPYFFELNQFELPDAQQGLAGFWDEDGDGDYDPLKGDYPYIEVKGCETKKDNYPDQMIFWIYNDAGNIHGESQGSPIQMEIQVQAFSYGTRDEINDMTFQRYKLINRATEQIRDTYFAVWVDADLGCFTDDYIGCDTSRSLAYYYNVDAEDGNSGCDCPGGVGTYCDEIPVLGIDYFRGPQAPKVILDDGTFVDPPTGIPADTVVELGMSSFVYFNNPNENNPAPGTTDPDTAEEFYNYLTGFWRDGTPFTFGGSAYNPDGGTQPVEYTFTEPPNVSGGWSMCEETLPEYDRRTVQASGPFRLDPGAINELIIGAVWVPDFNYPCPNLTRFFNADDLAQSLFDNCFELLDGPDAPDVDFVELDQKIIAVFTNDTISSNNPNETYQEIPLGVDTSLVEDKFYNFEGYVLYQVTENNSVDLDDIDKARAIARVDVKNDIVEIFNWTAVPGPNETEVFIPEVRNEGATNEGITHTFEITEDQFASGNRRLINHKEYYFTAVAYAYNNWKEFDPTTGEGQRRPHYLGNGNIQTYAPVPRPIVDVNVNSDYGDGPVITRLDGVGVGGNFVSISEESERSIIDNNSINEVVYKAGAGPIDVSVYNPLEVQDGEFILTFVDENLDNDELDNEVYWELQNVSDPSQPIIRSQKTLDFLNEQILGQYGFTIKLGQTDDVGDLADDSNGAIGANLIYKDESKPQWFAGLSSGEIPIAGLLNYVSTGVGQEDNGLDPSQSLTNIGDGTFIPFYLNDYRTTTSRVTPGWVNPNGSLLRSSQNLSDVNNIDIVFTPNQDDWSRCVVVETANLLYDQIEGLNDPIGNADQFDLRQSPAVGKSMDSNGNPAPDNSGRMGMGWFPGYAIDVETGKRLNIFFGENSIYDGSLFPEAYADGPIGTDMMWNPSSQAILNVPNAQFITMFEVFAGAEQFVYVTNEEYDECEAIYQNLKNSGNLTQKLQALKKVTWSGFPTLSEGANWLSYEDGLIPSELKIELRVDNPYAVESATDKFNGYPSYQFKFDGVAPSALNETEIEGALDMINVVPNPYYAYSEYERNELENIVKITNLPAKCTINIYSLDGKFIRRYDRDETPNVPSGNNRGIANGQIIPDVEWNMKNNKGIPIAGGIYLIHVDAGELGERVIKWFGTNRQFDPSGL